MSGFSHKNIRYHSAEKVLKWSSGLNVQLLFFKSFPQLLIKKKKKRVPFETLYAVEPDESFHKYAAYFN